MSDQHDPAEAFFETIHLLSVRINVGVIDLCSKLELQQGLNFDQLGKMVLVLHGRSTYDGGLERIVRSKIDIDLVRSRLIRGSVLFACRL